MSSIVPPRYELPLIEANGRISREWYKFLVLLAKSVGTSPTSSDDLQSAQNIDASSIESIATGAANAAVAASTLRLLEAVDLPIPTDASILAWYPEEPVTPNFLEQNLTLGVPNGNLLATGATLTNNAAGNVGTLNNAPAAGNPTKWIKIVDNGTTRSIPTW